MCVFSKINLSHYKCVGTVPARSEPRILPGSSETALGELVVKPLGRKSQLGVYLPDVEERAMGYVTGPCCNPWGIFADGTTVAEAINAYASATANASAGAKNAGGLSGLANGAMLACVTLLVTKYILIFR